MYYLLDIVNTRAAPVNPPTPFVFDDADAARVGTARHQGSSPQASHGDACHRAGAVSARADRWSRSACRLPAAGGTVSSRSVSRATSSSSRVIVEESWRHEADVAADSSSSRRSAVEGTTYIVGSRQRAAGRTAARAHTSPACRITARAPRDIALALGGVIVVLGAWASTAPTECRARPRRRAEAADRPPREAVPGSRAAGAASTGAADRRARATRRAARNCWPRSSTSTARSTTTNGTPAPAGRDRASRPRRP